MWVMDLTALRAIQAPAQGSLQERSAIRLHYPEGEGRPDAAHIACGRSRVRALAVAGFTPRPAPGLELCSGTCCLRPWWRVPASPLKAVATCALDIPLKSGCRRRRSRFPRYARVAKDAPVGFCTNSLALRGGNRCAPGEARSAAQAHGALLWSTKRSRAARRSR